MTSNIMAIGIKEVDLVKERLDEDGELERKCSKCNEWWPADKEFFFTTGTRDEPKLHSWCKACYLETKRARYEQGKRELKKPVELMK